MERRKIMSVKVIKSGLSKKLTELFLQWVKEHDNNREHDVEDVESWNDLVEYLMNLEEGNKVAE
jgi:hypothetical protein